MYSGYFWTILLGILWSSVGIIVALARNKQCPIWSFYCCGSAVAVLLLLPFSDLSAASLSWTGAGLLALGALGNTLGQTLTMYNLRGGARAIIFSLQQMNFVFTYILSLLFLSEKITVFSASGMLLLLVSVLGTGLLGGKGEDHSLPDLKQLLMGIAAAMVIGGGQYALLLAGSRYLTGISPATKAGVVLFFNILFYGMGALTEWREFRTQKMDILRFGTSWAIGAALSYMVLFHTINKMNEIARGGLVFAIGCSTCILFFYLFSVLKMKDRITWKQILLISGILAGVILLRF